MSIIDIVLICAIFAYSAYFLLFLCASSRIILASLLLASALATAQLATEGFYWHFIPAYGLLALVTLLGFLPLRARWSRWLARLLVFAGMIAAALPFIILPVPDLPTPTGPHHVGTAIYRLVDQAREDTLTAAPDRRNVIVQAWYPTESTTRGKPLPYLDAIGRLPADIMGIPTAIMTHYGRIDTHAVASAELSPGGPWPVILFSPGFGTPRAFYTALVTELASHGFVVLAVDHPHEVAVTELADGTVALPLDDFDEANSDAWMAGRQSIRTEDLAFVVDTLAFPDGLPGLTGRLDLTRVTAAGHSFGGAASANLLATDNRIRAAINIDGTPYGDLPSRALPGPFLLIESDPAITGHSDKYRDGNAALLASSPDGRRLTFTGASHYSFTDAPLLFAWPGQFALGLALGSNRDTVETIRTTADEIDAFIRGLP